MSIVIKPIPDSSVPTAEEIGIAVENHLTPPPAAEDIGVAVSSHITAPPSADAIGVAVGSHVASPPSANDIGAAVASHISSSGDGGQDPNFLITTDGYGYLLVMKKTGTRSFYITTSDFSAIVNVGSFSTNSDIVSMTIERGGYDISLLMAHLANSTIRIVQLQCTRNNGQFVVDLGYVSK